MKKPISHEHKMMRARSAGMAAATAGRARVFTDRKHAFNDSDEEIAEGLAQYADRRNGVNPDQLAADYSDL
ncbi:MAG TPA: hypothetical protein VHU81_21060 [Thermoanaerobaculia bacterium]|jgi:hypothetical protein|nr:hypothetical protein [Thermoanaerobaculia bacterium]